MSEQHPSVEVSEISQLDTLLKQKKIYHMPKEIQLTLNFPWLDVCQKKEFEELLSVNISECGCAVGGFFARLLCLVALLGSGIYLAAFSSLPMAVKGIYVLVIPLAFTYGQLIGPLVALGLYLALGANFYDLLGNRFYYVIGVLALAYGLGAMLGKTYGSLSARVRYKRALQNLKDLAAQKSSESAAAR